MDTAEYDTNALLINHIASIAFRIYEPTFEFSSTASTSTLEIENDLRQQGHIVLLDGSRSGLWHFRLLGKQGHNEIDSPILEPTLDVGGIQLNVVEEGALDPSDLHKPPSRWHAPMQTPTSSVASMSALDQAINNLSASASQSAPSNAHRHGSQQLAQIVTELEAAPTTAASAYEKFIAGLLLSVTAAFCSRKGAIPLNYRTILIPSDPLATYNLHDYHASRSPVLASLKVRLTTTGALIIHFVVTGCKGLSSLDCQPTVSLPPSTASILTAPFGILASSLISANGAVGVGNSTQTPSAQAVIAQARPEALHSSWRHACSKLFRLRGISPTILADCSWISVNIPKSLFQGTYESKQTPSSGSYYTVPWPALLCFRKRSIEVSSTSRVGDTLFNGRAECVDPLSYAHGWLAGVSDRDDKMSKRRVERALASKDALVANGDAPSPAVARRPSTIAAGVIYPTPPDAVQQPNGVPSAMDMTLSSPGNPLSVAPATDTDHASFHQSQAEDECEASGDADESKPQRNEGSMLGDADHVFSDMGEGDMFDDHDITEADFNFFDEQPDDHNLDMPLTVPKAAERNADAPAKPDREAEEVVRRAAVAPSERDAAVFAKPELKHARSSRTDVSGLRSRDMRSGPAKREPSPFDPHAVFKRVRASLGVNSRPNAIVPGYHQLKGTFRTMHFGPALPLINKKYEQGGLFDYRKTLRLGKPAAEEGVLPETDYFKRRGKPNGRFRSGRSQTEAYLKGLAGLEPPPCHSISTKIERSLSDDDSSLGSDQDDSSYTSEEAASPFRPSIKPLNVEENLDTPAISLGEFEPTDELNPQLAKELPRLAISEPSEQPISLFFSDPEPLTLELSLGEEDSIQVAQILTDQVAIGSLDIFTEPGWMRGPPSAGLFNQTVSMEARNALETLRETVPAILKSARPVGLKDLLDIPDILLLGNPTRLPPRPVPGRDAGHELTRPRNLYQISGPHLEVRRSDTRLSILPSAVPFWESLGLAPSCGGKSVNAVCIFPDWNGMLDKAKAFMGYLKSTYETLKLGSFESITAPGDVEDGALAYRMDSISTSPGATMTGHGLVLVESMRTVLEVCSKPLLVTASNIVIYCVYSSSNPGTIVEACAAFQEVFDPSRRSAVAKEESSPSEFVLQLVSANSLSSPTTVVVTPTRELTKMCMETYDRCVIFGGPMPAPAIKLEQPLPRIIDFKLNVTPSVSLVRENSCIHVAYAQSADGRWITAAWTDDRGNQQETASYCLARKGLPQSRPLNDVAHAIWELTLDLVSTWKVHWRVVVTKCGPVDQAEIDFWAGLARTEMKASVTLILLTVDTDPSLQLLPPLVKLPPPPPAHTYTTPASTPQTSIVSPEQSGAPATPSARDAGGPVIMPAADGGNDAENDAVLSDVTDQTWGAVVGHRLNTSSSIVDVRPALASGYLIKRTGSKAEDPPVVMEVNLAYTDGNPRAYEQLLREMLSYFRGLGTLARARGVVQRETDIRPWHIAAAEKGVRALYLLM